MTNTPKPRPRCLPLRAALTVLVWGCLTVLVSGCAASSAPVLRLDGINPCQLITPSQADSRELRIIQGNPTSDHPGITDCAWSSSNLDHPVIIVVRTDITRGVAGMNSPVPVRTIHIHGVRVLQGAAPLGTGATDCVDYVDVAPGESLLVSYDDYNTTAAPHHDQACVTTSALTAMILTTLHTLQR